VARKLEQDEGTRRLVSSLLRQAEDKKIAQVIYRVARDKEIAREAMRRVDRRNWNGK